MHDLAAMRQRLHVSAGLQALAQRIAGQRRDDPQALLEVAEFAGGLAWTCHGGTFALPTVEEALRAIRLSPRPVGSADQGRLEGRTLHVLTEAYPVGGHTRLVRRWIERMEDDRHAVVLVRQREPFERGWVAPEGRDVPVFDLLGEGLRSHLDRAGRLAGLMGQARRVVLHIHPDDAVSVAAAHRIPGMDLQFLNHADHVAWLGAALPATVLNLRRAGVLLGEARRGIPASACGIVPIPIPHPPRISREQARIELGIGDQETLMLTVATGYKYLPIEGRSLEGVLTLALGRPGTRLMAVGPGPDHPMFARLAGRFPGRVHALGVIPDPGIHRAAADIYLDSYPFCSPTSMLESAVLGTPVVSMQPDADELGVLYSECPGLPREAYAAGDEEGYLGLLEHLLSGREIREARSHQLRQGMEVHFEEAWCRALSAHLAQTLDRPAWDATAIPLKEDHLDALLAGLGLDPRYHPKLKRWRILGARGPLAVLRERLLG